MESEDPFLAGNREIKGLFSEELNKVNRIALPMILVTISQYVLRVAPMMMLGHLSELSLSSASVAISFSNVTGFSVIFGMAGALETLCGQAYGAEQYERVGTFTYGAIICLFLMCLPVSLLWIYTDKLLIFIGQDPLISKEAGKFAVWLIPSLFPYAILQSQVRYLQTQSVILPMFLSCFATLCFHLPLCWAFIFKLNLGNAGAALSIGVAYCLNVVLLGLYVKFSPTCKRTFPRFSLDVFSTMREFFQFAVPSAVMVCLEWWSFELVILLSGLLPNPQLETSVLSICMTTTSLHYHIPYSFGAAASTRISNELGAGKPQAARVALDEKEVADYIKEISPFLCLSIILDSTEAVLSGVARGSGWQHIGAYANLGAFYLVGIPVALLLGFVYRLNGKGLWIGLVAGATVQSFLYSLATALTDWEKLATEARRRIFEFSLPRTVDQATEARRRILFDGKNSTNNELI